MGARALVEDVVGELGARGHPELPEHLVQVVLHGPRTDEQLSGDLPVCLSSAHQIGDLRLLGVSSSGVPSSRFRVCSPVARSSTRARSAKQGRPMPSNMSRAARS